jgi:hypothetical protein
VNADPPGLELEDDPMPVLFVWLPRPHLAKSRQVLRDCRGREWQQCRDLLIRTCDEENVASVGRAEE